MPRLRCAAAAGSSPAIPTTLAEYLDGIRQGLELLSPYVSVEAAAVPATVYEQAKGETPLPLIPITSHISVPEAGLE